MRLVRNGVKITGQMMISGELDHVNETREGWVFRVESDGARHSVSVSKAGTTVTISADGIHIKEGNSNA